MALDSLSLREGSSGRSPAGSFAIGTWAKWVSPDLISKNTTYLMAPEFYTSPIECLEIGSGVIGSVVTVSARAVRVFEISMRTTKRHPAPVE